ncbi:hypothetical protein [Streptomyces sp. CB03911]|uniref:hypothetical protein n=1 Tax=Streptomyces sp. CB03911 TaxID=1804758 RepID=UPI00093BC8C3|nr:hypothetical protein [Streptomyces sp. CB03911]
MLRHVIAPSRAFTQIANSHVWDESLSDAAFRLLVRALALPPARARATTVTELAAGLSGGRITADRARRQLTAAGLLHCARRRSATGQVRTESLVSNVPLDAAAAERLFAGRLAEAAPGAGRRSSGGTAPRASGTALPAGGTPGQGKTSPHPVPPAVAEPAAPAPVPPGPPPGSPSADGDTVEAERVLLALRRSDPRLVLGAAEVARLLPLAAEWLARGVSPAGLLHVLTAGLPVQVKSPAALVRCRLADKMPPAVRPLPLLDCADCERAFRPLGAERRCAPCRQRAAAASAGASGSVGRVGWRERLAAAAAQ